MAENHLVKDCLRRLGGALLFMAPEWREAQRAVQCQIVDIIRFLKERAQMFNGTIIAVCNLPCPQVLPHHSDLAFGRCQRLRPAGVDRLPQRAGILLTAAS